MLLRTDVYVYKCNTCEWHWERLVEIGKARVEAIEFMDCRIQFTYPMRDERHIHYQGHDHCEH